MNREVRFGLVLTPAEKCALARLSEIEGGLSKAAMVRCLIRREARRHSLWPVQDGWDGKAEQVSERGQGSHHLRASLPKMEDENGKQQPVRDD